MRLAIVPDGELQDVAFGALPAPPASGAGKMSNKAPRSDGSLPMIVDIDRQPAVGVRAGGFAEGNRRAATRSQDRGGAGRSCIR